MVLVEIHYAIKPIGDVRTIADIETSPITDHVWYFSDGLVDLPDIPVTARLMSAPVLEFKEDGQATSSSIELSNHDGFFDVLLGDSTYFFRTVKIYQLGDECIDQTLTPLFVSEIKDVETFDMEKLVLSIKGYSDILSKYTLDSIDYTPPTVLDISQKNFPVMVGNLFNAPLELARQVSRAKSYFTICANSEAYNTGTGCTLYVDSGFIDYEPDTNYKEITHAAHTADSHVVTAVDVIRSGRIYFELKFYDHMTFGFRNGTEAGADDIAIKFVTSTGQLDYIVDGVTIETITDANIPASLAAGYVFRFAFDADESKGWLAINDHWINDRPPDSVPLFTIPAESQSFNYRPAVDLQDDTTFGFNFGNQLTGSDYALNIPDFEYPMISDFGFLYHSEGANDNTFTTGNHAYLLDTDITEVIKVKTNGNGNVVGYTAGFSGSYGLDAGGEPVYIFSLDVNQDYLPTQYGITTKGALASPTFDVVTTQSKLTDCVQQLISLSGFGDYTGNIDDPDTLLLGRFDANSLNNLGNVGNYHCGLYAAQNDNLRDKLIELLHPLGVSFNIDSDGWLYLYRFNIVDSTTYDLELLLEDTVNYSINNFESPITKVIIKYDKNYNVLSNPAEAVLEGKASYGLYNKLRKDYSEYSLVSETNKQYYTSNIEPLVLETSIVNFSNVIISPQLSAIELKEDLEGRMVVDDDGFIITTPEKDGAVHYTTPTVDVYNVDYPILTDYADYADYIMNSVRSRQRYTLSATMEYRQNLRLGTLVRVVDLDRVGTILGIKYNLEENLVEVDIWL